MMYVGDILSTVGMFSTMRDIMVNVRDILSIVGDTQYRGGYHDASGGYHEYHGGRMFCYLNTPKVLNTHSTHNIPMCIMISSTVLSIPCGI